MTAIDKLAQKGRLTFGIVFPIEAYQGSVPKMQNQEQLAKRAEELGFQALWFRDVPFHDPSFGDVGQMYDPWVYIAHIMNHTERIALATGSIILPLRHPVHTAKSINSIQVLSNSRLVLGVASGDRPVEYPAFNRDLNDRSSLFRENFFYLKALQQDFPVHSSQDYGITNGSVDLLPKYHHKTPMLVTGHSGQSINWIAEHADGWLYYPRDFRTLQAIMDRWKFALEEVKSEWKPFMQSLYVDLLEDQKGSPKPIHLGFQSGTEYLIEHLKVLQMNGVNHVIINLKYSSRPAEEVLEEFGELILEHFA